MAVSFRVEKQGSAEVVRKKSRFLSVLLSVNDEKQAFSEIEKIKKEHYNARHNCFAFIVGANPATERFSDDGEPQGTAGKVILEVMKHNNLSNALIVVTRYFGGVLLGTGGLTEAYSSAAAEAVKNAGLMRVLFGRQVDISLDYTDYGKIEYLIRDKGIPVLSSDFAEGVNVSVMTLDGEADACSLMTSEAFVSKVTELTNGKGSTKVSDRIEFGLSDGKAVILNPGK